MTQIPKMFNILPAKLFVLLVTASLCCFIGCTGETIITEQKTPEENRTDSIEEETLELNSVDSILERLRQTITGLKSYQAKIKYTSRQPLLESETVRKGRLYYTKETQRSKLRLDFNTIKQDDAKEQAYREQVFFDGVWLVRVDYQLKRVEYRQLAEPNMPIEPLDLAAGYLPIVGFAKIKDMKKQFDITLLEQPSRNSREPIHLRLQVKNGSRYKDTYSHIELWLDTKLFLPARILAVSSQDETEELEFYSQNLKKKLSDSIFQVEIPNSFSKNIIDLKQKAK